MDGGHWGTVHRYFIVIFYFIFSFYFLFFSISLGFYFSSYLLSEEGEASLLFSYHPSSSLSLSEVNSPRKTPNFSFQLSSPKFSPQIFSNSEASKLATSQTFILFVIKKIISSSGALGLLPPPSRAFPSLTTALSHSAPPPPSL
jgi:hypothetical protein